MLKHTLEHFHSSGAKGLLISQDTSQKESAQLFLQEVKMAQTRIICEKDHTEDAAVSHRFSELQISSCFFLPCGSSELLMALIRSKSQLSPSHCRAALASKQKIITNLPSSASSKFGGFVPLDLEGERGVCGEWRALSGAGGSVFTGTQLVNRNTTHLGGLENRRWAESGLEAQARQVRVVAQTKAQQAHHFCSAD